MSDLLANCGLHSDQVYVCKHCAESQLSQAREEIERDNKAMRSYEATLSILKAKLSKLERAMGVIPKVPDDMDITDPKRAWICGYEDCIAALRETEER